MTLRYRLILAAFLHAATVIVIALIGGGWWGLGRVDPLLAVPGLGWACAIMLWAAGPMSWRDAAATGGATAMMVAGVVMIWGAGPFPFGQWLVFALGSAGLAIGIARWVWPYFEQANFHLRSKTLKRVVAATLCGFPLATAAWAILPHLYDAPQRSDGSRLALLTSLPLTSGRADIASVLAGQGEEEPALTMLRQRFRVAMVDALDPAGLGDTGVLLLAHPPALSPQQLVTIDDWVRGGGRALILADGLSSWEPSYVIGDPRNPPLTSLLTPLLSHWGLALDAPPGLVAREEAVFDGGQRLHLFSPGRFRASTRACRLMAQRTIADCIIGSGRAIIIADADWLGAQYWGGAGKAGVGRPSSWRSGNMLWLVDRLDTLSAQDAPRAWARPVWIR